MITTQEQLRTIAELELHIPVQMKEFAQILQIYQDEDDSFLTR